MGCLTLRSIGRAETVLIATSHGYDMSYQFTQNLHSEGWWNHMPPGHRVDIIMNADALSSPRYEGSAGPVLRPANASPRVIKRSHASAWILLAALGATGGALAVATIRDPHGMRERLDATLEKVKHATGSSAPTTTEPVVAQAPTPVVQEPAPVITAQAPTADEKLLASEAPLPPIAPAAGRSTTSPEPVAPVKQVAPPAPSKVKELTEPTQVVPPLPLPVPLAPSQPLPTVQPPPLVPLPPVPVAPPVTPPPVEEAVPVPPQPPASAPPQ